MLKERIVTAVVLATLLLGSLLSDKPVLYSLLLGAFVCIAAWEWAGLIHCRNAQQKILYAILLTLPLPFLYFSISTFWVAFVVLLGVIGWCLAALMVLGYQVNGLFVPAGLPVGILTGLIVLVPAWTGLVWLYPQRQGPQLIFLFFATIWVVDIVAFGAGRRWGKNRLANRVSPGKTWEGFYAGIVAAFLLAVAFVVFKGVTVPAGIWLVILCVVCAVFSVIGDLFISMFKRHANVKDTSHLLPGHGGVLDRIDSITAAAPVFATGIWMLGGRF